MATILLIEDDAALQEAYSFLLSTEDHIVASAYNGQEGLTKAKLQAYDIILLDMHMPIMGGLEFLEAFQPIRPAATKIIVFSNMVEPEIESQARNLGADACILKSSMTPTAMLDIVQQYL